MKAYLGSCFFSLPGATDIGKTPQNSALAGVSNDFKQAHSYDCGDKFGQDAGYVQRHALRTTFSYRTDTGSF